MSEHPRDRQWEPEDPMKLNAAAVEGDPEIMLASLVEEYARVGMGRQEIQELFDRPFYQATHSLKLLFGEAGLQERIARILARCGVLQVRTTATRQDDAGSIPRCAIKGITDRKPSPPAEGSRRTE